MMAWFAFYIAHLGFLEVPDPPGRHKGCGTDRNVCAVVTFHVLMPKLGMRLPWPARVELVVEPVKGFALVGSWVTIVNFWWCHDFSAKERSKKPKMGGQLYSPCRKAMQTVFLALRWTWNGNAVAQPRPKLSTSQRWRWQLPDNGDPKNLGQSSGLGVMTSIWIYVASWIMMSMFWMWQMPHGFATPFGSLAVTTGCTKATWTTSSSSSWTIWSSDSGQVWFTMVVSTYSSYTLNNLVLGSWSSLDTTDTSWSKEA